MRILELGKFYPPYRGGMETLLRSWSEGFVRSGATVECVVANDRPVAIDEVLNGVHVHRLASLGKLFSVSLCPEYVNATRAFPADVWHAHLPNPLADLACLRGDTRVPLVISYHSDIIRQSAVMGMYRPLLHAMLRRADRIVVATPAHIENSPVLPRFRDKCEVIPFGVDLLPYAKTPALLEQAEEYRKQAGGRAILLNIGRLVGYKGQRYLIEAARSLDAVVWIVGTGPLRRELEMLAEEMGVGSRVRFWDDASDSQVAALLHACDVFVLPSITPNEAFGMVQIEAMACGKPVVSCRLPSGVPWVNRDGETGRIVPPADAGALA
ncbi:MAG TPA: glycosyltransferase, partial [Roseimicrobium sp.]|nr:glycosyltransferase [Roseimicrobium sp.]